MKKLLLALVAVFTASLVLTGCSGGSSAITTVDASTWMKDATQPGVTIIDVRTPDEFAAAHVEGAVNMNVEGPDFQAQIATLDKNGTVAVYCHSGRRSQMAADQMASAGFTKIINLKGGIADLASAGAPIVQ